MSEREWLDGRFQDHRPHLHSVAFRILGSTADADDAVQEAWLRLHRTGPATIDNPEGWLSTVVARVAFDMLRKRSTRALPGLPTTVESREDRQWVGEDPEGEVVLHDSVAGALVAVMDTLSPAQRLAFVLHEGFAVPYDSIAEVLSCSPQTARQHASRARRRVRRRARAGLPPGASHREIVAAFLGAAQSGDVRQLVEPLRAG